MITDSLSKVVNTRSKNVHIFKNNKQSLANENVKMRIISSLNAYKRQPNNTYFAGVLSNKKIADIWQCTSTLPPKNVSSKVKTPTESRKLCYIVLRS